MTKQNSLTDLVFQAMDRLIPRETGSVLCAFSGGADSAALLCLLSDYRDLREQTGSAFSLYAAHIHHGIRGEEADRDAIFCADFCKARSIPLFTERVDAPSHAKAHRLGLEEAARELRYRMLNALCTANAIDLIATAHNATDQLETMLMRLIRGSGLDGLCGIPERNRNCIRPLLALSKEDILAFCKENGIPFVIDSTNEDEAYTRNYIRAQILPMIKQINPAAESSAAALSSALTADKQYLEALSALHEMSEGRAALSALHDSLLSRLLRREFQARFPQAPMLTSIHVHTMIDAIRSDKTPISVTLPGNAELRCDRDAVMLREKASEEDAQPPEPLFLKEGWQAFDDENGMILLRRGILTESDREKIAFFQNIYNLANNMTFDSATMSSGIYVRARQAGDRYFDARHTRCVRKLLQTLPLPSYLRARYPILCDAQGILWIPGFPPRADLTVPGVEPITVFCFYEKRTRIAPEIRV